MSDCPYCAGSGWVTCVDLDGESAYETACPEGCSTVPQPVDQDAEVPF